MRIELELIQKIEMYLMGTLSPNDNANFESEMSQNLELQNNVDFQRDLVEGIRQMGLRSSTQIAYKNYRFWKNFRRIFVLVFLIVSICLAATFIMNSNNEIKKDDPIEIEGGINSYEDSSETTKVDSSSVLLENEIETSKDLDSVSNVSEIVTPKIESHSENKVENRTLSSNNSNVREQVNALKIDSVSNSIKANEVDSIVSNTVLLETDPIETAATIVNAIPPTQTTSQWRITFLTTEQDLGMIAEQIDSANGEITYSHIEYRKGKLLIIEFKVSSSNGKVHYRSEKMNDNSAICITLTDSTISAGDCDFTFTSTPPERSPIMFSRESDAEIENTITKAFDPQNFFEKPNPFFKPKKLYKRKNFNKFSVRKPRKSFKYRKFRSYK